MKTFSIRALILIMAMSFNFLISTAQITKTIGGVGANYSTLKLAFDAINSGSITGVITLQITGSTTETASASINASGIGSANYSSVKIYPTGSGYSISTSVNTPLINLNAANNITIDGRVNCSGSTPDFTIKNLSTGNSSPAIRFVNSAQSNDIKYCNIKASTINTVTGIILFSSASTGTGNSNNIIENCNITNAGGNRPVNSILIAGTSGHENNANIIRNNNIYDFLNPSNNSQGVNINSCAIGNIVKENNFYETTTFAPTGKYSYRAISTSALANQIISSNYIGGNAPHCGGTPWTINSNFAHYWCGIFAAGGNSTSTLIENNLITNISDTSTEDNPWDGIYINTGNVDVIGNTIGSPTGTNSIVINTPSAYATTTLTDGVVTDISIIGGGSGYTVAPAVTFSISNGGTGAAAEAEITNGVVTKINILNGGSGYTSAPSVNFDSQSNMYSTSHGMIQNSSGIVNITNNNIGSITTYGTDTYSHGWESVYVRGVTGTTTFDGNLIGSLTTPNSIHTGQGSPNSRIKLDVYGIYSSSVGTTIIKNNTVANLTNNYTGTNTGSRTRGIQTIAGSNTIQNNTVRNITSYSAQNGTRTSAAVIGISQTSFTSGTTQIVSDNFVNNIVSANGSAKVDVYGILYVGPNSGSNYISDNFVHSITATTTNTSCEIDGIVLNLGLTSCYNNIVDLGLGISTGYKINGLVDDAGTNNNNSIYFNSVYLGGAVTGVTSTTAALLNNANNTTRVYENNILYNGRSGGTTGKHYSAIIAGNTNLTIDYNDYYVSVANSNSVLMKYGAADKLTIATIKTATGQDLNSLNINPLYTASGGTDAQNYYASAAMSGISINGISNDYDNLVRNSTPKIGAFESNNYVWQGGVSTDFGTAANWVGGVVPPNGADVTFAATPTRNCVLDQNRILADITNAQSFYKLVLNGKQLTVTGNLTFSNGAQIDATTASSTVVFGGLTTSQTIQSSYFVNNAVDGLTINNSNGIILNGNLTVNQQLSLLNGSFSLGANTLTLNGSVSISSGTLVGGSSTNVIFNGNGDNTVLPAVSVNNLTVNRAAGITLGGSVSVAGTLTLTAGTLTVGANTLTNSGNSPSRTNGTIDAGNSSATLIFSNTLPVTLPASLFSSDINNLTISGVGGLTSNGDFGVNGILNLQPANPSKTKGILDMGAYTLSMGTDATTIGTGDVTGIVKRTSFAANIPYTFGNLFTTMTFSAGGTMPTELCVKIVIGTAPSWKSSTVQRYYDIKRTGGLNTTVMIVFHYLPTELQANSETNLVFWDYHAPIQKVEEHGKSNQNLSEEWVAISNRNITYFDTTFDTQQWTLSNKESANVVWQGTPSTDWNDPNNWSGGAVPTSTSDVVIPNASTTVHSPTLPASGTVKTLVIQPNGILNGGSYKVLTVSGSVGAWLNMGIFNPETSNVVFTNANAIIADQTNFYNLTIANGASLTLETGNIMRIAGGIILQGNGILHAATMPNTVEFNGSNQSIINANGTIPGFYNLILSGSGIKTMPVTKLDIAGNLTITGTTTAVTNSIINVGGNLNVEQNATFELNAYNHIVSGNILCDGIISTGQNSGSLTLNGNTAQSIDGSKSTEISLANMIISDMAKVMINKDITVKNNMTISSGCTITINPTFKVNVIKDVVNNAGISGIYIKSSPTVANGSLIFHNSSNSPVNATVEMYSKANWNLDNLPGSKYQWQYFGIPVKTVNADNVFSNCYVRKWNETGSTDYDLWNLLSSGSTMTSFAGYELVQSNPTTYTYTGQLENNDFYSSMSFTSAAVFPGQHIYGNPYTAAIDISKINFGEDTEASVYLYNTGNYTEWQDNNGVSAPGNNPGQYTVATKQTAGLGGIPGQIPTMQGFLVKALKSDATISIPYSSVSPNTEMQRISSSKNIIPSSKVFTRIDVKSGIYSDCMWIFSDSTCKRTFDNGWDGNKILSTAQNPQIFAIEPDGNYQIDAVPDFNETYLGFLAGQETEYKLSFTHQNIESKYANIYLVDLAENKTVNITENGSEYSFTAYSTPKPTTRFKIITLKTPTAASESMLKIEQQQKSIILKNNSENSGELIFFNLTGSVLKRVSFSSNSLINCSTEDLQPGIYLVKAFTFSDEVNEKLLIR